MRLVLDAEVCQGHGRCYSYAPELFDADAEGHGVVLVADLRGDELPAAELAVRSCPEEAIALYE